MADSATDDPGERTILESLSAEERAHLERTQYVKTGEHLVWIEPDRTVRREKLASLYYIRTSRGMFRISRLNGEVVEV